MLISFIPESFTFALANFSFFVTPRNEIDDAAIQQFLNPLEKLEADIRTKIESIESEKGNLFEQYSLFNRTITVIFFKFAWLYGISQYIIKPATNAIFEFTAKKLSVTPTSSLFLRAIPWIPYLYAASKLNTVSGTIYSSLANPALKTNQVFKAIRVIDQLKRADEAYNNVRSVLDAKIKQIKTLPEELPENAGPSTIDKLESLIELINILEISKQEFREKCTAENQLKNNPYFIMRNFIGY